MKDNQLINFINLIQLLDERKQKEVYYILKGAAWVYKAQRLQ